MALVYLQSIAICIYSIYTYISTIGIIICNKILRSLTIYVCVEVCINSMFVGIWRYVPILQCVRNNDLRTKLRVGPWSRKLPVKVKCSLMELNLFILTLLSLCCLENADYVKRKHSFLCRLLTFGSRFLLSFYILFFTGFSLWFTPRGVASNP